MADTLTLQIPTQYAYDESDTMLETYLNNALLDYFEAKDDKKLRDILSQNEKFHTLNKKIDTVL